MMNSILYVYPLDKTAKTAKTPFECLAMALAAQKRGCGVWDEDVRGLYPIWTKLPKPPDAGDVVVEPKVSVPGGFNGSFPGELFFDAHGNS
jgi:hypothetical protein